MEDEATASNLQQRRTSVAYMLHMMLECHQW